jgi:hypothetical protein
MNNKWTSHLLTGSQEKEDFRNLILASKPVLDRLVSLLETDCKVHDTDQLDRTSYDNVNWPLLQADHIASKRTYRKIAEFCKV